MQEKEKDLGAARRSGSEVWAGFSGSDHRGAKTTASYHSLQRLNPEASDDVSIVDHDRFVSAR